MPNGQCDCGLYYNNACGLDAHCRFNITAHAFKPNAEDQWHKNKSSDKTKKNKKNNHSDEKFLYGFGGSGGNDSGVTTKPTKPSNDTSDNTGAALAELFVELCIKLPHKGIKKILDLAFGKATQNSLYATVLLTGTYASIIGYTAYSEHMLSTYPSLSMSMYTSGGAWYGTKHFGEGKTQGESQKNAMLECSTFHECRVIATLPSKIPGCIFSWTKMNQGVTRHAIITKKGQEDLQDLILTNNDQRRIFETIYRCNNPSLNEYAEKKFDELIVDLTGKSASDLTYKEETFNDTVTFRFNWEAVEAHINKTESHYFYIAIANDLPIKTAANKSSETKATASKDSCVMVQNDGSQIRNGFVLATVRASDGSTVTGYMSADYLRLATQGFTESTCRAALN